MSFSNIFYPIINELIISCSMFLFFFIDLNRIFSLSPRWMNFENARHFLRLSMAAYGWPFVMYLHCVTGVFRLLREVTCCACFRSKAVMVTDDNCCFCHLAGVKYISKLREQDILFASFRNHVFEVSVTKFIGENITKQSLNISK